MPQEDADDSDTYVSNAIIVACIIGIILVAALIVLSPRQKESFTQLWLKPHKLNLTNASSGDENVERILRIDEETTVYKSELLGAQFYVFEFTEGKPLTWFPANYWDPKTVGSTFRIGPTSFFLDAVDLEGSQILFWEYPRNLNGEENKTRFSFVIENNLGRDHDYRASIILSAANENVTKAIIDVPVRDEERKTVTAQIQLSYDEAREARGQNFTKIIVRLDTSEEVFFWLGGTQ